MTSTEDLTALIAATAGSRREDIFAVSQSAPLVIPAAPPIRHHQASGLRQLFRVVDTTKEYGEWTQLSQIRKRN